MNIKNTMLKMTTVAAVVFSFISCEDDFETIGSGVIGEPGFATDLYEDAELSAKTNSLAPVQTNNLPLYLLGVYDDPVFETQTASILSQVNLTAVNPDFGNEPVLDSVVLYVPYLSHEIETKDGEPAYALDSVYGNQPIKLSIYETNFFLNNLDPDTNFEQSQKYYSNLGDRIENNINPDLLYLNESFVPRPNEIVEYPFNAEGERDTLRLAPGLRFKMSTDFFQKKILNAEGSSNLANSGSFRNYFRSLLIKAEKTGDEGNMMLLNLDAANTGITLYYTTNLPDTADEDDDGDESELVEKKRSYKLMLGPARVNTFEQEVPAVTDAANIYLKGGEGSMAIIDLFSGPDADENGVSDELEFLRESKWLINEANLEFYVNRDIVTAGVNEPERLYIYDLNNNVVLRDYILEKAGQMNPMTSLANQNHLGALQKDASGQGIKYKIKLTQHINNVLNNDSTNVRLGLVVSQNVNLITNSAVLQTAQAEVKRVPVTSVITPEATVLYGPNAEDEEKRLKLKIYYTEPKN